MALRQRFLWDAWCSTAAIHEIRFPLRNVQFGAGCEAPRLCQSGIGQQ